MINIQQIDTTISIKSSENGFDVDVKGHSSCHFETSAEVLEHLCWCKYVMHIDISEHLLYNIGEDIRERQQYF